MKKIFLSAMMLLSASSLRAEDPVPGKEGGMTQTLMMLGMAVIFFYFILWRPEQKRRKKVEQQRSSMKVGDRVTAMGIVGTLAQILESTVIVKMVDGSKIEMVKSCITDVQSSASEKPTVEESK